MTASISQIPTYVPQTFFPPNHQAKEVPSNRAKTDGSKAISDLVDLSSFQGKEASLAPSYCGNCYSYHEQVSAFQANMQVDYEGKDGSELSIHLSYKAMYRMVHYEISQTSANIESAPEANPHSLDDYFGPKETAERIVDFARELVNRFRAQEDKDMEKLRALFDKLIDAINEGFKETKRILGPLPNNIADMIDETYSRVMNGMERLEERLFDSNGVEKTTVSYHEEVTYKAASMKITIEA
ncbi:MAG: DUF5610 domain-containing protein [Deltaproteobacteria bacterium]|nr:DUF5610 domain-containing protein [Deltaproteobacteria bacterium]